MERVPSSRTMNEANFRIKMGFKLICNYKMSGAIGTPTLFLQNPTLNKIIIKNN